MSDRAFVVVPFERVGITIGPRQAYMFPAEAQARVAARQIASRFAGVAVIARETDPETGDDKDTLLAGFGAVPPHFPDAADWTFRLN
ncbi:MAG: hypothetical protein AB7O57_19240 [Hyphomicrobiaceae bacterium]